MDYYSRLRAAAIARRRRYYHHVPRRHYRRYVRVPRALPRRSLSSSSSSSLVKYSHPEPKECKFFDGTIAGGAIGNNPAGWSLYYLPQIVQGTTASTRIGLDITATSLSFSCDFSRNPATTVQRVRYMVVQYEPCEGANLSATELFQTTGVFLPQRYLPMMPDFRILKDSVIELDSAIRNQVTVRFHRRVRLQMKYTGNGGVVGDQVRNSVFVVVYSDSAANQPTIANINWRVTFHDD